MGTIAGTGEESARVATLGLNWFPAAAPQFSLRGTYVFGEVENPVGAINANLGAGNDYDFDGFTLSVRRDF